ncbi:hypothetical protein KEM52_002080 [Ascosphaera acerosa]|nr:hypothetical protein KEM52_002080 [Ascosphaera acerosa]
MVRSRDPGINEPDATIPERQTAARNLPAFSPLLCPALRFIFSSSGVVVRLRLIMLPPAETTAVFSSLDDLESRVQQFIKDGGRSIAFTQVPAWVPDKLESYNAGPCQIHRLKPEYVNSCRYLRLKMPTFIHELLANEIGQSIRDALSKFGSHETISLTGQADVPCSDGMMGSDWSCLSRETFEVTTVIEDGVTQTLSDLQRKRQRWFGETNVKIVILVKLLRRRIRIEPYVRRDRDEPPRPLPAVEATWRTDPLEVFVDGSLDLPLAILLDRPLKAGEPQHLHVDQAALGAACIHALELECRATQDTMEVSPKP